MSKKKKKIKKSKKIFRNENFKSWNFATINIRSGTEKDEGAKMYAISKELVKYDIAFCCLQEVRWRDVGSKIIRLDTGEAFEFHWSGYKKKRQAGVGILIRIHNDINISSPDFTDPRVMAMDIKVHGFNIRIVNGYAPTEADGTEQQKLLFYSSLNKALVKTQKKQKLIVVGDFNATTSVSGKRCFFDGKKIVVDNSCNDNGNRLKLFCRTHELCISNTFFKHRMIHRYTWYSNDGRTRKIIDYILTEPFVQKYMTDCRVYRGADIETDHRLLRASMCTPSTRKARRKYNKTPSEPKRDVKSLLMPENRERYVNTLNQKLQNNPPSNADINVYSQNLMTIVEEAANETLPPATKINCEKELWKDDESLNLLLAQRSNTQKTDGAYKHISRKIKKRVQQLRNLKMQREADEINEFATKRQVEELFKSIKSDGSTFKTVKRTSGCDPAKLKEYFQNHFSVAGNEDDKPTELSNIPQYIEALQQISCKDINHEPPKKDEIIATLKSLKNGKASNDIPAEFYKYALTSVELVTELEAIFQQIWNTGTIPTSWGHSKLLALWKGASKGSVKDPSTHRGLQIGSSLCKIMIIIILNRLKDWYNMQLLDQQQGFRRGRGTADGIYITKRIQQITDKMGKPAYVLFVDLSSAFDHVIRRWLFDSIYQRFPQDVEPKLFKLIESLYSKTTTALADNPEDIFELLSGVRQGGPESPPLYNLYMDYVMRVYMSLCEESNIQFLRLKYRIRSTATTREERAAGYHGQHTVDWCGYADDLELVFETLHDLEKGLNLLNETFSRFHLNINSKKTKTMIVNFKYLNEQSYPKSLVKLNGQVIENIETFRYLGDDIRFDQPCTGDTEIDLRIAVAQTKFNQLSKKLNNRKIFLKTRVCMLNTMVRSRLTYSCQTWNINKQQQQRVQSAYISMLRKMIRGGFERTVDENNELTFKYVLSSDDVLHICNTEDVLQYVKRQQGNYLAHIARQSNTSIVKRLLFNDDRNRKRGRPIKTLEDHVLEGRSADSFYKEALKKKKDMVGSGSNHSMDASAC